MSTSLLDFIVSCKEQLTSTDKEVERKGILAIHDSILQKKISVSSSADLHYLVQFLTKKLAYSDENINFLCLDLLHWLVFRCDALIEASQLECIFTDGIFKQLAVQALPTRQRLLVLNMLRHLLSTEQLLSTYKKTCPMFLSYYIQAVDAEKSPQHILTVFEMNFLVMRNISLQGMEEEFFETMAIYFPIDYTPPKKSDSIRTVSRRDLSARLHICLWESRLFSAPFLLPTLLEKCNSDLKQARLDGLYLMGDVLSGELSESAIDVSSSFYPLPSFMHVAEKQGQSVLLRHLAPYLVSVLDVLRNLANKTSFYHSSANKSALVHCVQSLVRCYHNQECSAHQLKDFGVLFVSTLWPLPDVGMESACCGGVGGGGDCLPKKNTTDSSSCRSAPPPPSPAVTDCLMQALQAASSELRSIMLVTLINRLANPLLHLDQQLQGSDPIEKFYILLKWSPHLAGLNRILETFSLSERPLLAKILQADEVAPKLADLMSALVQSTNNSIAARVCSSKRAESPEMSEAEFERYVTLEESILWATAFQLACLLDEGNAEPVIKLVNLMVPLINSKTTPSIVNIEVTRQLSRGILSPVWQLRLLQVLARQCDTVGLIALFDCSLDIAQSNDSLKLLLKCLSTSVLKEVPTSILCKIIVRLEGVFEKSLLSREETEFCLQRFMLLDHPLSEQNLAAVFQTLSIFLPRIEEDLMKDFTKKLLGSMSGQHSWFELLHLLALVARCPAVLGDRLTPQLLLNLLDVLAADEKLHSLFPFFGQAASAYVERDATVLGSLTAGLTERIATKKLPTRWGIVLVHLLRCAMKCDMKSVEGLIQVAFVADEAGLNDAIKLANLTSYLDALFDERSPLHNQKMFNMVFRLQLHPVKSSPKNIVFRDAYARAFLLAATWISASALASVLDEVMAVTLQCLSDSDFATETKCVGLFLLASLAGQNESHELKVDDKYADDLLRCLTDIGLEGEEKLSVELRISLAKCLLHLINFPAIVCLRHSERVLELLDRLKDDRVQVVRIQAAVTYNAWQLAF